MRGLSTLRDLDPATALPYLLELKVRRRAGRASSAATIERWLVGSPASSLSIADYHRLERRSRRLVRAVALVALGLAGATLTALLLLTGLAAAVLAALGIAAIVVAAAALLVLALLWVDRNRPPGRLGLLPLRGLVRPVPAAIAASEHWHELVRVVDVFVAAGPVVGYRDAFEELRADAMLAVRQSLWQAASVPPALVDQYLREVLPERARAATALRMIFDGAAPRPVPTAEIVVRLTEPPVPQPVQPLPTPAEPVLPPADRLPAALPGSREPLTVGASSR